MRPGRSPTDRTAHSVKELSGDLLNIDCIQNVAEMADFVADAELIATDQGFFCGDGGI